MNKFLYLLAAAVLVLTNVILYSCNNSEAKKADHQTASIVSNSSSVNEQTVDNQVSNPSTNVTNAVAVATTNNTLGATTVNASKPETNPKEVWAKAKATEKATTATVAKSKEGEKEVWAKVKTPTTPAKTPTTTAKTAKTAFVPETQDSDGEVVLVTTNTNKPQPTKLQPAKAQPQAQMVFAEREYDFGTIIEGEKVQHKFTFTNKGEAPLIVTDANSTCGCTIPEFPKTPIMPGQSDVINVSFDSKGKIGLQDKHVTVTTNAGTFVIHLKGVCTTKNLTKE